MACMIPAGSVLICPVVGCMMAESLSPSTPSAPGLLKSFL